MDSELFFKSELEISSSHKSHRIADELDSFLDGTRRQLPANIRIKSFCKLLEALLLDEELAMALRSEGKLLDVVESAVVFNLDCTNLVVVCLLVLTLLVKNPMNHSKQVLETIWNAFKRVLDPPKQSPPTSPTATRKRKRCFFTAVEEKPPEQVHLIGQLARQILHTETDEVEAEYVAICGLIEATLQQNRANLALGRKGSDTTFQNWWRFNNGYQLLSQILARSSQKGEKHKVQRVLQLLEVLTSDHHGGKALPVALAEQLLQLIPLLTDAVLNAGYLRVLLNVSASGYCFRNNTPIAVYQTFLSQIIKVLHDELLDKPQDFDLTNSCLCIIINLCEHDIATRSLLSTKGELIPHLLQFYTRNCAAEDTETCIVVAYTALLICIATLGCKDNRLMVLRHLQENKPAIFLQSEGGDQNPLAALVATLQEFVLFQSDARVLTKQSLVALCKVIDDFVHENGIALPEKTTLTK